MKFINYLEKITGVSVYPLTSLMIFFVFFILLFFWIMKADKKYLTEMKNLPINEND